MVNIALVCQHGASTGLCQKKMTEAAEKKGIECVIKAYPDSEMKAITGFADCILLGPQLAFKKDTFVKEYPEMAERIVVIPTMDFGMLNGEKILNDTLKRIEELKKGQG